MLRGAEPSAGSSDHEAPSSTGVLDRADIEIIQALKDDGRMAFSEISRRLGVSPGMVRQRYQRLVENGVLHIAAITNPFLTGHPTVAVVGINADFARIEEVAAQIAALPEVTWLVIVAGRFDLVAEVNCRDQDHLLEFLSRGLNGVDGVRDTETFTQLRVLKDVYFC
jgi:Lrp/AsnC family transcriptional regulator for asnA, asnC and gidA